MSAIAFLSSSDISPRSTRLLCMSVFFPSKPPLLQIFLFFFSENLFFFVIFRNFAAHLRELCNRTWVREGVIGASEYSWSILAKSGGKFMVTEKPQK